MTNKTKPALYALTPEAHATVLTALRHYHGVIAGFNDKRPATTAHGTVQPLDYDGIGELCKSIDHTGLDFSAIVPLFAESSEDSAYVRTARENQREGSFEIDDPAVVSHSDAGAYVMGWMWVDDDEAGLSTYWTLQLGNTVPDGAKPQAGQIVPPEPVWYFGDELDHERAVAYARELGFKYEAGSVGRLPDDEEGVSDFEEFKEYADEIAAQRDPV